MINTFYIIGGQKPRARSNGTIFVDGAPDSTFREDMDLELSHWLPNRTPEEFKAGTSTEICLKFAKANHGRPSSYDLVVNNHLDVDGVLSVYVLLRTQHALECYDVIKEAAEMGDFWGWGNQQSQTIFLALIELFEKAASSNQDIAQTYEQSFDLIDSILIHNYQESAAVSAGLANLAASLKTIEGDHCTQKQLGENFIAVEFKKPLYLQHGEKMLAVATFNEMINDRLAVWPHVLNKNHAQRIKLVSVECGEGWYYDLYYPGYMWAETKGLWRAPGMKLADSTNAYFFSPEALKKAVSMLADKEANTGTWYMPSKIQPFYGEPAKRGFPVVLSFLSQEGKPAPSNLGPDEVSHILSSVF